MPAEIIAIGTELTTGAKLDTNSQWLSQELAAAGIAVTYHTTVADDLAANVAVLRTAIERVELVIITGGLGPTLDDLTRDALAAVLGRPLVLHEPSLETIRGMFARRNRTMPERNVSQAMFPAGSEPIANPRGTAPGIYVEVARAGQAPCRVVAMPGVPSEMKPMFRESVLPRLAPSESRSTCIRQARVNCFGVGESAAEELLGDVTARGRNPEVGITVHEATITLRIVAQADSPDEAQRLLEETKRLIYERMGDYAFGEEDDELEHVVLRLLAQRNQSLATAECGTVGLAACRLTSADTAAGTYAGGTVAPTTAACAKALGLGDPCMGATREAAQRLARACRERFGADVGLAATELSIAGSHDEQAPAPKLYLALADSEGVHAHELNVAGDPAIQQSRAAKALLNLLRLKLLRGQVEHSFPAR